MPASSGAEESDQQREAEAYNYNIYLMVATPYLLVAAVGAWVYLAFRRKARLMRASAPAAADPTPSQLRPATGGGP